MEIRTAFTTILALSALIPNGIVARASDDAAPALPPIQVNDNRTPAGTLDDDALVLNLRAAVGVFRPEGENGPALTVEAFGEDGSPLSAPAPLIRVPEGTTIVASIRNELGSTLRVHGLCTRDGSPCPAIEVPASGQRDVTFAAGRAGTYHYWATTTGMPLPFRAAGDTQLSGAFIVDTAGANPDSDRVLVITDWTSLTVAQLRDLANANDPGVAFRAINPRFTFLINGLSWPATERLTYALNDEIRWRVVNLSSQPHPMHLHGFYFDVTALGDGMRDAGINRADQPRVVTQLMAPGGTMGMTWRAERVGNWVFHCHISEHIAASRRLSDDEPDHDAGHASHAASTGMAGLVIGVTIVDPQHTPPVEAATAIPARKLTLLMQTEAGRYGKDPAYGFLLADAYDTPPAGKVTVPGPTLALRRDEPVEITLVNRLPEATAIHWHGMELESYYDGVHGWSGAGTRVTPLIEPGGSFLVRFTPPRAGTFIYHTHMHDDRQLSSGMYGALLVLDPEETFDPATDQVIVLGRAGRGNAALAVLNGEREPQLVWKAGVRHRIRFINITPGDIFVATLGTADGPVTWRPLRKDGAPVPPSQAISQPATLRIAVGETYDFEYEAPAARQGLWLNVRTPAGRWQVQGRVVVR